MVSTSKANDLLGREVPGFIAYEDSEQGFARRELLHVEKLAIKNKQAEEMSQQAYVDSVRNDFHKLLLSHFEAALDDVASLYHKTLGLDEALPELLDLLAVKACSIGKLEPLAARVPWLFDELLKVVNAPQHRRKDSRGKVIIVETLRTALSFINIENLQMLIPALLFRRTIPQITDPYPQIKSRVWQYSLAVSLSARELTEQTTGRRNEAFVFGMLHGLGRNAIARTYFRMFDRLQREQLELAQAKKERDRHDALTQIKPSGNFLIALWNDYSDKTTANLISYMQFKRLFVHPAAVNLHKRAVGKRDMPLSQLMERAMIYAQFRLLQSHKVIEKPEINTLLRMTQIPVKEISRLNKFDLRTLPLNMQPDLDEFE